MAITGFDPSVVITSIRAVKSAYNDLIKALGDDMQRDFVDGMATKWACKDAQTFFTTAVKPSVDELITNSNTIFDSVVKSMNSAAQAWASETGSSYSAESFSPLAKKLDVAGIQENISGVRGIDLVEAKTVAAKLSVIANSANAALTRAQNAVNDCGFIGGNQSTNLIQSLGVIKTKIDNATKDLTAQAKSAIDATVDKYSNTEGKVSEAFASRQ